MKQTFYSNGKLLLIGEYTVLEGANAFALPTKHGQYLHVEKSRGNSINWTSKDADGETWLDLKIPFEAVILKHQEDGGTQEYNTLVCILHEAYKANPDILKLSEGFTVVTELTFPRSWGLGTSSTLINNIAQWFCINAFELLKNSFGGSGYDIACAQNDTPILFRLNDGNPVVEKVNFNPTFKEKLFFVYLNRKQNSRSAIAAYKAKRNTISDTLATINSMVNKAIVAKDLSAFCLALEEQEQLMSAILETPTAKETFFPDFKGTIKSLGAWGGDFILAISEENPVEYFKQKGYGTIIPYHDMILK